MASGVEGVFVWRAQPVAAGFYDCGGIVATRLAQADQPRVTRGLRWIGALGDAGRQELREIRMELEMEMPTGRGEINGLGWLIAPGGGSQYQHAPANPSRQKGGFSMGQTRKKRQSFQKIVAGSGRARERVGSREARESGARVVVGGSLGCLGTMEHLV